MCIRDSAGSEPLKQEVATFIDCCDTGKVPPTDLTEALAVQRVLEQMHMSINSYGRTDSVPAAKETVTA